MPHANRLTLKASLPRIATTSKSSINCKWKENEESQSKRKSTASLVFFISSRMRRFILSDCISRLRKQWKKASPELGRYTSKAALGVLLVYQYANFRVTLTSRTRCLALCWLARASFCSWMPLRWKTHIYLKQN